MFSFSVPLGSLNDPGPLPSLMIAICVHHAFQYRTGEVALAIALGPTVVRPQASYF
jgi:hypothetical protein